MTKRQQFWRDHVILTTGIVTGIVIRAYGFPWYVIPLAIGAFLEVALFDRVDKPPHVSAR